MSSRKRKRNVFGVSYTRKCKNPYKLSIASWYDVGTTFEQISTWREDLRLFLSRDLEGEEFHHSRKKLKFLMKEMAEIEQNGKKWLKKTGTIREPATPGVGVDMSYNPTTPVGIPSTPGIPQTPGTPGMVSLPPRTPGTPGMMPPSTPGAPPTPFGAPQTPGMPSTPGMHSMVPTTPMGVPSTPGTPGMMMPQTPGTPGVPATPGTPGMMPPSTPGAYTIEPAAPSNASWVLPNIEVKITDNDFAGGKFANSTGVISQVDGDTCLVNFDGEEVQVPTTILDKTVPKNKSFVVVVSGNDRGAIGRLMGIDQTEAIVRLDGTYDLLIVPFNTLARFVKSEES